METASLKSLAIKVLEGNQEGNSQETKSFLGGKQEGNSSKSFPVELPRVGNQETSRNDPIRARGYGCGCGHSLYQQVEDFVKVEHPEDSEWKYLHTLAKLWMCEKCGATYQYIGGSKGPVIIN